MKYRVSYVNPLDGLRRVLVGQIDKGAADAVLAKWGDPKQPAFYMGKGTRIDECDGTPDGAPVTEAQP